MYQITTYTKDSIATLKNTALRKSLSTMLIASNSGRNALWKFAKAVAEIITKESFKDDFDSQADFVRYVSLSKTTITTYVKAVEFIGKKEVKDYFQNDVESLTVGKAYLLSVLSEEELKDFLDFIEKEEVNVLEMSDKALKDMLRELYSKKETETKEADAVQTDVTDDNDEEIGETDGNDEETGETDGNDEETEFHAPIVTAAIKGNDIVITIAGRTFSKERVIAMDDEILESIKAEFGA